MRIVTSALLISLMSVTACGAIRESRVNPWNWGNSTSEPVEQKEAKVVNPLIPQKAGLFSNQRRRDAEYLGEPIDQVTGLVIERLSGGALIRATGITATQGAYQVQLTPENEEEEAVDGVLTYRFEARSPETPTAVGTQRTRTVVAARQLSNKQLSDVRTIRVIAARNVRTTRRR